MGLSVSVQINGALQTSALLYDTTSGHTSAQRQTESWSENTKEVHRWCCCLEGSFLQFHQKGITVGKIALCLVFSKAVRSWSLTVIRIRAELSWAEQLAAVSKQRLFQSAGIKRWNKMMLSEMISHHIGLVLYFTNTGSEQKSECFKMTIVH